MGITVNPPFRQGVAVGDTFVLTNPTSLFRLVDENQAMPEMSAPRIASMAFDLIEAL